MTDSADSHPTSLKLILVDSDLSLVRAWERHFRDLPDVRVVQGRFEGLREFDCLVTAGNSFGLMDGGVDAAVVQYFGVELLRRVQARILEEYLGEQSVGTSFLVETGHPRHHFVAHTPTMRVPMSIAGTDHPYVALWAALLAVHAHNRVGSRAIHTLACPGLGTGTGEVPADEAARQMAAAWRHFVDPPSKIDWGHADRRQSAVLRGGDLGFMLARAVTRRPRSRQSD